MTGLRALFTYQVQKENAGAIQFVDGDDTRQAWASVGHLHPHWSGRGVSNATECISLVMRLHDYRSWQSLRPTVFILLLAVSSAEVTAGDLVEINPPYPAVGLVNTVTLEVKNAVKGGCWTKAKDVEANTRVKLEQSGIAVEDEITKYREPTQAAIYILANGSKVFGDYCVANVEVAIVRNDWAVHDPVYIATVVRLYDNGGVVAGQAPINDPIASMVDSFITKFAADVLKYRRSPVVKKALKILEPN